MATPIRLRSLIGIARLAEPASRRQGAGLDEPTTFLPPAERNLLQLLRDGQVSGERTSG
jgi:hypothetical protein